MLFAAFVFPGVDRLIVNRLSKPPACPVCGHNCGNGKVYLPGTVTSILHKPGTTRISLQLSIFEVTCESRVSVMDDFMSSDHLIETLSRRTHASKCLRICDNREA